MARTGRRPGTSSSRTAILDAARTRFAAAGYAGASLRLIAADAGVDPAVVIHFFGSKDGLFREAVGWPFDPAPLAARFTELGSDTLGRRLARVFLSAWDDPAARTRLSAVLRSALADPERAALLREFVTTQLFGRIAPLLSG